MSPKTSVFFINFINSINSIPKIGEIWWISRISEFCSNVFNVLTRNPLSFSSPDCCWTLHSQQKCKQSSFSTDFFFKSDRTANFRVFSHLELSKAWKALKKSSLRKEKSDRTPNFRVFSQLELSKAWKALKKTSLRKEKSDRTPNFRVSSQLELSKWQNDKFWSWKSEYLLEQTIF